uniref:hypothetical protein n=1 Tax=Bacteroides caccae TaxID=47678 RepID=UPI00359C0FFA
MNFQKVAACCTDMVIIVRYAVSRLSATEIYILSFSSLRIPFAAKKYIICYPAMDFPEVEVCGTDLVYILNSGNQQCGKSENKVLIQT